MVANGGVATIGERARAPVTNPGDVVRVPAEDSGLDSAKEIEKRRPN